MRKVLFKKYIPKEYDQDTKLIKRGTGIWTDFAHEGIFHQWGSTFEEFAENAGNQTVAIVERPDGSIETVNPTDLRFIPASEDLVMLAEYDPELQAIIVEPK